MKTRTVEVEADLHCLDGTVDDLVGWAMAIQQRVPAEYRHASRVSLVHADDGIMDLWVSYERPETAADREADRQWEEDRKLSAHAREFAEYERLRKKFEGKA
jgi:hypothetical protein